jgi:exonuclease III
MLSKIKPLKVKTNFKHNRTDTKGRFLSLEFETAFVIGIYAPNSSADGKFMAQKLSFFKDLGEYFDSIKPTGKKM